MEQRSHSAILATMRLAMSCVAKTVALVYPDRFRIMSIDEEIDRLGRHSGAVFSRDAQLLQ